MVRDDRPTSAWRGSTCWRFALGCALAFGLLGSLAEGYLRLFPPQDLDPYLAEESPLTGIYQADEDFSVSYASWDALRDAYANRLGEFLPIDAPRDSRPIWAFWGNSFVHAPGMLADHARKDVTDRHIFNLGGQEPVFLRCAQVKMMLDNGLRPERIFFALMPLDVCPLGTQPLATNHVTARGALTYRLPENGPQSWVMSHSRLALTAGVRNGWARGNPRFRGNKVCQGVDEPLLGDLRLLFGNLARITQEHAIPVTAILIPDYYQVRSGASCGFQDTLGEMMRGQGYDVLDPRDAFRRQPDLAGLFLPDKHFSPRGNQVLLAELLEHLGRHWSSAQARAREP
jgi:hypothetical protein